MDKQGLVTTNSGTGADFLQGSNIFLLLKRKTGLSLGEGSVRSMNKLYFA